ncbi:MAG: hypothetical protein ACK41T_03720 [Pseudobdellovibrio sp.]
MKHTKQPWNVETHDSKLQIWSTTEFIAEIPPSLSANREANAKLIAAAPEMLEVLEQALRLIAVADNNQSFKDCALPLIGKRTISQIEDLLTKIRG